MLKARGSHLNLQGQLESFAIDSFDGPRHGGFSLAARPQLFGDLSWSAPPGCASFWQRGGAVPRHAASSGQVAWWPGSP